MARNLNMEIHKDVALFEITALDSASGFVPLVWSPESAYAKHAGSQNKRGTKLA